MSRRLDPSAGVGHRRDGVTIVRVLLAVGLMAGCGIPVGVQRSDSSAVHRALTANVLSAGVLSTATRNVLYQRDLVERFDDDPAAAIVALHAAAMGPSGRPDDLFALAELCLFHGEDVHDRSYHIAAAVYAHAFLFPHPPAPRPDPLDPRSRLAVDLFNRGIVEGLIGGPDDLLTPEAGVHPAPFGTIEITFDPAQLIWEQRRLGHFVSVSDLKVTGLPTRYRWPGIGAPFAARVEPLDPDRELDDFILPWVRVPVTAVLQIDDVMRQLATGRVTAALLLRPAVPGQTIDVDGRPIPLEVETTSSLALTLAESPVWQQEIAGFLQRVTPNEKETRLASLEPYQRGRVPVVLVHGTASSAGRWAQMLNELYNDPRIGPKTQFWLFTYDTGNPILYSAMLLREAIAGAVQRLDPDGTDDALRRMVVVGHSQGGLLAKLTALDSGDAFWRLTSDRAFDDVPIDPTTRDLARRMAFVEPSPYVRRLVFLATPQAGSYIAGNWLAHRVARLITLPTNLVRATLDLVKTVNPAAAGGWRLGTSVDNMTPGRPFIKALAALPIAPGVVAHSIIAAHGDRPLDDDDDGVVQYRSAHIAGVESELVVQSGHSCQDNPHTIEEVRRILLRHLDIP